MKICVVFLICFAVSSASRLPRSTKAKDAVLKLNDDNFHKVLAPGNGKYFIRFYTSLCEVCKAFTPEFVKVGEAISDDSKKIQVGDFDCHNNKKICDDLWIDTYPYFMVIDDGEIEFESDDEMTVEQCIAEAKNQMEPKKRSKRQVKDKFSGNITEITGDNFESIIAKDITIVLFGMAWCPHCQTDLDLMTDVQNQCTSDKVKFVMINCAKINNLDLCFDELVGGVPTINVFANGKRTVKNYSGTTVKKFNEMVAAHLGGGSKIQEWKVELKSRKKKCDDEDDDSTEDV